MGSAEALFGEAVRRLFRDRVRAWEEDSFAVFGSTELAAAVEASY